MSMRQILETIRTFDGVVELAPGPGSGAPELAWGDHFFYYSYCSNPSDGQVPQREQPNATAVTKDYPGDTLSRLDEPGRWRLNVHVGRSRFVELVGEDPRDESVGWDLAADDVVLPHPVYRAQGWVSIVNPGERTSVLAVELARAAHEDARRRWVRTRVGT